MVFESVDDMDSWLVIFCWEIEGFGGKKVFFEIGKLKIDELIVSFRE